MAVCAGMAKLSSRITGALKTKYPQEDTTMKTRLKTTMLSCIVIALLGMTTAYAECTHLPQAIEHTKLSVSQSEATKPDGTPLLTSNLAAALEHAKASEKAEKNKHTAEAIVHLEAAMKAATAGDFKACHTHTQEALKQLESAAKCEKK